MSAPKNADALRRTMAAAAAADANLAQAEEAVSKHRTRITATEQAVAIIETELKARRVALALGEDESTAPAEPDLSKLERLRADLQVSKPVEDQLNMRLKNAQQEQTAAEKASRKEFQACLIECAVEPARYEVYLAFETLRTALVKLMAVHHVTYEGFGADNKHNFDLSTLDHGPAQNFLREIQSIPWERNPYPLQPLWTQRMPWYAPHEMPSYHEARDAAVATLNAKLQELAA